MLTHLTDHRRGLLLVALIAALLLTGCAAALDATGTVAAGNPLPAGSATPPPPATLAASATPPPAETATPAPDTATPSPSQTPSITPTATADTRLTASQWTQWPVVPSLSARAAAIYRRGLEMGNNPRVFSRIGDCQSEPEVFLGIYDTPDRYFLDEKHEYLRATIQQFSGSFGRANATVRQGFGVASVFSPLMSDPKTCNSGETPLECEFRINKPSIVFISMGTNWCAGCTAKYEEYLRMIVDFAIDHGAVPVVSTKADNIEGDNSINKTIARVAYDYDIPMWNFWRSVQYLPNHGLKEDNIYLTVEGWDERSFTGLMALDSLWKSVIEQGIVQP